MLFILVLTLLFNPSIVSIGVAYIFYLMCSHKKKSQGVKSGERGDHKIGLRRSQSIFPEDWGSIALSTLLE